jgi:hypothetical protein
MSCSGIEYLYAALIACFVLVLALLCWYSHSMLKILKLRHPLTLLRLRGAAPLRICDADENERRIGQFVTSGEHRKLNDPQLTHTIIMQRVLTFVAIVLVAVLYWLPQQTPHAQYVIQFGCWQN